MATRAAIGSLAVAVGLLVAGAAAGGDDAVAPGRDLFRFYCASCHGGDARGHGPVAPHLRQPPADLTRIAVRRGGRFPADEIAEFIDGRRDVAAHGPRLMPVWGRVLRERTQPAPGREASVAGQIQLLVDYLRSIQVREDPAGPRG